MTTAIWKFIATAAVTALLTLAGAYFNVNAKAVTQDELHAAIASDHDLIKETHDDVKALRDKFEQMDREIGELRGMRR